MIHNPTDEDFFIEWANENGKPWKYLVPNKKKDIGWGLGNLETQKYLARWYLKHMKDKIINDKGKVEGEKMLALREEKGLPQLTKSEEQNAIWAKTPRTTEEKELKSVYPVLYLGTTREFDRDYPDAQEQGNIDQRTPDDKVFEDLATKKYEATKAVTVPSVEELEELMPKRGKNDA
jgi:hypothetical protein